jgi:hypothetical protein
VLSSKLRWQHRLHRSIGAETDESARLISFEPSSSESAGVARGF